MREVHFVLSCIIDLIGMASYAIPGFGEVVDVVWAPISATILYSMYGSWIFSIANFIEEIIPGLDFIPTALIAWYLIYGAAGAGRAGGTANRGPGTGGRGGATGGAQQRPPNFRSN
jgi:hypothetical protein